MTGSSDEPPAKTLVVGEFRDELAQGVVKGDQALLVTDHRCDRGDRLGHRVDAKAGVGLDRRTRLEIAEATADHIGDLAVAGDDSQEAGQPPVLHVPVEVLSDQTESSLVETHLRRVDLGTDDSHRDHPMT